MSNLGDTIVAIAREYQGVTESPPGSNSGPQIDAWLHQVGQPPGVSWCAAYACDVIAQALVQLAIHSKFRPSASALHLLTNNPDLVVPQGEDPEPGDLAIFDHQHGLGHVSIVTGPATSIAGNTSPDGLSRNGTGVFEHGYNPANPQLAGYVRVA